MLAKRPVGRGAQARKYDLLTAIGAHAAAAGKAEQRLALRLITLITARYNWARDELTVGQREIARLWAVDERTVKREMARLRARGWLVVRRQGARGRVTEHGLAVETILRDTSARWAAVGPDFAARMQGADAPSVVPFPGRADIPPPDVSAGTEWALAQAALHAEDPATFSAWVAALRREGRAGGRLTLRAPSRFHAAYVETHLSARLAAALRAVDPEVAEVTVVG